MRTSNHIGLLLAMLGALAVGCSSATHNSAANKDQDETAGGKDNDTTGPTPGGGKTSPGTPSGSTKPPAPPPPKPGTPPTVVYSQSGTTLYRLDPAGPKLDKVGDFSGVDGVCNEQTS